MTYWQAIRHSVALIGLTSFSTVGVAGAQSSEPTDCYDAIVSARVLTQTPSPIPDCGPDCIIMVWPWFMELDVKKVVSGDAPTGRLLTLTMQHTYFNRRAGSNRWWLRRNSLGGFNVLRFGEDQKLAKCAKGIPPAKAHIEPGPNKNLQDLLLEGKRMYGSRS